MIELVNRAKQGDADAFTEAILQTQSSLYRVSRSYLDTEEDAADAIQETVLNAWKNINNLRRTEFFKTWLIRILIRECLKIREKKHREIPAAQAFRPDEADKEDKTDGYISSQISVRKEWQPGHGLEFEEMMNLLRGPLKEVLVLYYGEEYSVKEIAEILQLSEEAVRQRLSRGRKEIKERYFRNEVAK